MKALLHFISKWGVLALAFPFLGFWTWKTFYARVPSSPQIACASLMKGCVVEVNQHPVSLQFLSPPSGKTPFFLRVQGTGLETIEAELTMTGMEMPPARFSLKKQADGTFKAEMLLPLCSVSRSDWLLQLRFNHATRRTVSFSAN